MEFNTVSKGAVYAWQVSKALKFHNIGFNKPHKCPFPGTFIPIVFKEMKPAILSNSFMLKCHKDSPN